MEYKVLDTNVLLHSPTALDSFVRARIIIPMVVLEELDDNKKRQDEVGRNARWTIKRIDNLQKEFGNTMILENGSQVEIMNGYNLMNHCNLDLKKPDNQIIAYALSLQERAKKVTFVSNDGAARVKARQCGLNAESLEEDRVKVKLNEVYQGWREIFVSPDEINRLHKDKFLYTREAFYPNEYALLVNNTNLRHTALARFNGTFLVPLNSEKCSPWGIAPRNMEQKFLIDALMNPNIQLVTALGRAGTGKTLVSIAAAGQQAIEENKYRRVIVYKPVIPMGRDIGFLPGTEEEKLKPWMANIYDSFEFIFGDQDSDVYAKYGSYEKFEAGSKRSKLDDLIDKNKLELSTLTYIRGRSLPKLFIIVDEAQNISPHELKTLISRAGEDTKIILTGDAEQIDHPFLDSQNNGLVYTIERFKGQKLFSHVTLSKPERSTLSALATELM